MYIKSFRFNTFQELNDPLDQRASAHLYHAEIPTLTKIGFCDLPNDNP